MGENITRIHIVSELSRNLGLPWRQCTDVIDGIVHEMTGALVRGDNIKISNFGSFEVKSKKERIGRNPKTGQSAVITARKVVAFHPTARLKNEYTQK